MKRVALGILLFGALPLAARTAPGKAVRSPPRLPVEEFVLPNGMKFLVVPRPQSATLAAGWMASVGSADETPGETGIGHLVEHLLFKGSRTIGARDLALEDRLLREQDELFEEIRQLESQGTGSSRRRLAKLRSRFEGLREQARSTALLGEYSLLYSRAGASDLDANTLRDLTLYFVNLPPESLELWFWMESDRLLEPVFREFHKEKAVVREERRLRVESTPTGSVDERLEESFWRPLPYRWRPLGNPEEVEALDRPGAERFFRRHYAARSLTAALVGPVDPERVRQLATRYFGRLASGREPPERAAFEIQSGGERSFEATCQCPPQARVLYPTVPFRHPDSYPLQVLAAVLNGRAGRLHRALVEQQGIAFSVSGMQHPLRRAGHFAFSAETKGSTRPAELVEAWDRELARLIALPISADELDRVRNRLAADGFRRLRRPTSLMKQLLIYEGLGSWREIDEWADKLLEVSAAEVKRVAGQYLTRDRRLVALYHRAAEGGTAE